MNAGGKSRLASWEYFLATLVLLGPAYAAWYFSQYGYLPQPFFYEPWGTYMDFFAASSYAHNKDAFEVFGTIYPPLSFALLKFISWGPCYVSNGSEEARYCDYYGIGWIFAIWVIDLIFIYLTFRKIDRETAVPRSIALGFGCPMLYGLERGNLLLFCFACVLLAYGPLVRSARLRWLFAGLAVNFKVYLVGTLFAQLLRRRWRWFEGAILATVLVYLVSFAIYGEGTPKQVYDNIAAYAGGAKGLTLLDLWYPSSFVPLRTLLEGEAQFPIMSTIGSDMVEWGLFAANALYLSTALSIVAASVAAWWRPTAVPMHRLIMFSIAMALITSEVSGYTEMLVLLFVFMEAWRGVGRRIAIVIAYVISIALEYPIERIPPLVRESYLSGGPVISEFAVGIGSFARPILFHVMVIVLALVTLRDVYVNALEAGWRLPFAWLGKRATA